VIRTRGSAVVAAAPSAVFALLDDPARLAVLAPNRVEVVSSEELPDGRRSTRTRTHMPGGATVEAENVVVERVPDHRLVLVSTITPFGFAPTGRGRFGRAETRIARTLEPHTDGTTVTVETETRVSPAPLRLYFAFAKRGQWQRATDDGLARLRAAFSDELLDPI